MNRRLLLGVDAYLSPPTQLALRVASELLERSSQDVRLVLLHVIPVPYDPPLAWGKSIADVRPFSPATQQRLQAERALWRAPYCLAGTGDCSRTDRVAAACGNARGRNRESSKRTGC